MNRILGLLVWITALNMGLSYNPPLPPFWVLGRQYDIYNDWEVGASSYKFPLTSQRLQFASLADYDTQDNIRVSPDCGRLNTRPAESHDSRMNERSIPNSHVQKLQDRTDESVQRRSDNGSSKILNHFLKPGRRRGQVDSNPITFPGPTVNSRTHYEPEIPASCRNSTYCEEVPNYPQDEINQVIVKLAKTRQFQLDRLDYPDTPDINQRVGPIDENIELCHFEEKVVYPKSAVGVDGKWYTLVNNRDQPVQGYRVEICNTSGGTGCAGIAMFREGYEARCKQKYVIRTATAFEKINDQIKTFEKEIRLPSCCSCVAKYTIP